MPDELLAPLGSAVMEFLTEEGLAERGRLAGFACASCVLPRLTRRKAGWKASVAFGKSA